MLNPNVLRAKDHSNNVEAEGVAWHLVAGNPDLCGTDELSLFAPAYLRHRAAEIKRLTGLYLDECYQTIHTVSCAASRHQVYVAVAVPEALLGYLPAVSVEPPGCDAFAANTHLLTGSGHGGKVSTAAGAQTSFLFRRNRIA